MGEPQAAEMVTKERLFFRCPGCGADDQHSVTHFMEDRRDTSFGPWQCDACGTVVRGRYEAATRGVTITKVTARPKPIEGYLLLRLAPSKVDCPVYFVVKDTIHTRDGVRNWQEEMASKRYWVEEHTCPTNIIRVEAIIEGADQDPHGVLEFVAFAAKPEGWDDLHGDWRELFPELVGQEIEGEVAPDSRALRGPDA